MRVVRVDLGKRSYDVIIGGDLFSRCARFAAGYSTGALLVTDETVDALYGDKLRSALTLAGITARKVVTPAGEAAKSPGWLGKLYDEAVAAKLGRKSPFIALGGGVPGDLTGFAAATYMRGAPFIQVPTTLLAQVDASVGGKVAINHPAGKNMIGAFHQPGAVFADLDALQTLSVRDYSSGIAEVVKCACLDGSLDFLLARKDALVRRDKAAIEETVARCCSYKARIVAADEREESTRMFLNLGHTYAHAIERAGDFSRYTHGEAVAIGLMGALRLSERLSGLDKAVRETVKGLLLDFNLPLNSEGLKINDVYDALWHDKKALNNRLRWVLIAAPGAPRTVDDAPLRQVKDVLEEIVL